MTEPDITINGVKLNQAQAMTVRCAIESFAIVLTADKAKTDRAAAIEQAYLDRILEIRAIYMPTRGTDDGSET